MAPWREDQGKFHGGNGIWVDDKKVNCCSQDLGNALLWWEHNGHRLGGKEVDEVLLRLARAQNG